MARSYLLVLAAVIALGVAVLLWTKGSALSQQDGPRLINEVQSEVKAPSPPAEIPAVSTPEPSSPTPAAPPASNNQPAQVTSPLVAFLASAEIQTETASQLREFCTGLNDLESLPYQSLSKKRYANYQGVLKQWTITNLLNRYLVPAPPEPLSDEEVANAAEKPASRDAIKRFMQRAKCPDALAPAEVAGAAADSSHLGR